MPFPTLLLLLLLLLFQQLFLPRLLLLLLLLALCLSTTLFLDGQQPSLERWRRRRRGLLQGRGSSAWENEVLRGKGRPEDLHGLLDYGGQVNLVLVLALVARVNALYDRDEGERCSERLNCALGVRDLWK